MNRPIIRSEMTQYTNKYREKIDCCKLGRVTGEGQEQECKHSERQSGNKHLLLCTEFSFVTEKFVDFFLYFFFCVCFKPKNQQCKRLRFFSFYFLPHPFLLTSTFVFVLVFFFILLLLCSLSIDRSSFLYIHFDVRWSEHSSNSFVQFETRIRREISDKQRCRLKTWQCTHTHSRRSGKRMWCV